MPEYHCELQSAPWIDQITNLIKYKQRGPIYIGNSYVKYERFKRDTDFARTIIEGDVKRFDSSLYITDIIIAMSILRLYYDPDDFLIDNHFVAMFDTVGIKDYYTPGGYVYRMYNGLPSGIKSTSLLGSFINMLNLCHGLREHDLKKIKFLIGGDDFLICCEDEKDGSILNEIESKCGEIGYRFKILKMKDIHSKFNKDKPTFYKYSVDEGEPIVVSEDVLSRVFIPQNKKYKNNFEILKYLFDLIPSLAAPRSHHLLFYMFLKKMYFLVTKNDIKLSKILNLHSSVYNKVMAGQYLRKQDDSSYYYTNNVLAVLNREPLSGDIYKVFRSEYPSKHILTPIYVRERKKVADIMIL